MGRSFGVTALMTKKYPTYDLAKEWRDAIGHPEKNFKALIWGHPGQGKTTFALHLCKELSNHGKVYYNSVEQGEGKSLQDVVRLVDMSECRKGSIIFGDKDNYEEMKEKLKKNRAKFCVIDSLQYANLTTFQYKELVALFPKKSFIIISWEGSGGNPKGEYAKSIRFMVDIKVRVVNATTHVNSRFGATKPYKIFEQRLVVGAQVPMEFEEKVKEALLLEAIEENN